MILNFLENFASCSVCQDLLIIAFIGAIIYFYMRSKASRKNFKCPNCGENIEVEHMKAKFCNLCGHKLEDSEDFYE